MSIKIKGVLTNSNFCIRKSKYDENVFTNIKNYLTLSTEEDIFNKDITKIFVYEETDDYLIIPKFMANRKIKIDDELNYKFKCTNSFYNPKEINITFNKTLRKPQQECIDFVMKKFTEDPDPLGGILKCSCGSGKTIMAIYLASILKVKTLIIVHQEFLMDQWIDRIKAFTDAKVGIIRQKKIELDNDIVIGMLHTICGKEYEDEFDDFGLVIYDEVHHLGSSFFSKVLFKTSCKYTIGLTATPERNDGMLKLINWFVGDILYVLKRKYDYRVLIKRIYFSSKNPLFVEKTRRFDRKSCPDNITMKTNLIAIPTRNELIIKIINTVKSLGRKIFIFSDRVEHLNTLKNGIDEIIKQNNEEHIYKTCYYMGSSKKSERKIAENEGDIIFATLKLAEEGLDISRLDTIILALPIKQEKTIIQSIGRILRKDEIDDLSKIPLVIDISDMFSIYKNWAKKRNVVYRKENWFVQDYYFNDLEYTFFEGEAEKNPMNIIFDDIDDEDFIEKNLIIKK
jgi:superfamily II DNA or RNA helicase